MNRYEPGQIVWVKLKGYPAWPAKVVDSSNALIPKEVVSGNAHNKFDTLVQFYNDNT